MGSHGQALGLGGGNGGVGKHGADGGIELGLRWVRQGAVGGSIDRGAPRRAVQPAGLRLDDLAHGVGNHRGTDLVVTNPARGQPEAAPQFARGSAYSGSHRPHGFVAAYKRGSQRGRAFFRPRAGRPDQQVKNDGAGNDGHARPRLILAEDGKADPLLCQLIHHAVGSGQAKGGAAC